MTINKELPGDSLDYHRFVLFPFSNKKQDHVSRIRVSFGYFWSLTFQVETKKNDG
jgi:hypothetical protein